VQLNGNPGGPVIVMPVPPKKLEYINCALPTLAGLSSVTKPAVAGCPALLRAWLDDWNTGVSTPPGTGKFEFTAPAAEAVNPPIQTLVPSKKTLVAPSPIASDVVPPTEHVIVPRPPMPPTYD
jgi:hypothetical protein